MNYNPYDFYFKKAKQKGFKARSAFKLEEIDRKYQIFGKDVKNILDIGCAPGSWLQFAYKRLNDLKIKNYKVIGFDIKDVNLNLDGVYTFNQDITDTDNIDKILSKFNIEKFDIILSDMAPNTIGIKDIDAVKSILLLEKTLPLYEKYLKQDGKFVIKIFMGPGFEEFLSNMRKLFGSKNMKTFKPQATRKQSKEIYIVKY